MKNGIRLALVAVVSLAVTACAPGARLGGGKEGAAEALYQSSSVAKGAKGAAIAALRSGAVSADIKVSGEKSGSATLSLDVLGNVGSLPSGAVAYKIKYDNFSDDGKVFYNGTLSLAVSFDFNVTDTSATGNVKLAYKGKLDMSGEISDSLDADVTETIAFSAVDAKGASVSIVLNGSIKTATDTYTYNNETISFTADHELAKLEVSKS